MTINHYQYGAETARALLQSGQVEELNAVLTDARSKDRHRRDTGSVALAGALVTIADALKEVEKTGIRFSVAIPSVDAVLYARSIGGKMHDQVVGTLINAVTSLRKQYPGITFSYPRPAAAAPSKAIAPAKPEPLEVKIIGLPERQTTTSVERDSRGNIVKSTQSERDAA